MSSEIKPIKLWGKGGPNPPKVAMLLEELNLPYEEIPISFADIKKPEYLAINPNGRMPAIEDPNTGITLWESGAIVEYLIERYDTKHNVSFAPGTLDSYLAKQWLYYQTTGQGPYFGQAAWFKKFTPEPNPKALERYVKETHRMTNVLEGYLGQQKSENDGPWLVGDKYSYADLSWLPWIKVISMILDKEEYNLADYPHVKAWIDKIASRDQVKKIVDRDLGGH